MHPRRFHLPLLALVAMFLAAGCSELPMSPVDGSPPPQQQQLEQQVTPEVLPLEDAPAVIEASATESRTIRGLVGGTVSAGDFRVILPPLAVGGTVTVTVTQPDTESPIVELDISPASANQFRLPVLLVAKASKMDRRLLSIAYISRFDPETGQWVRVPGCTVSLLNLTVTAPLEHFSRYRVEAQGKAGW